jgi:LysM repeat protein
MPRIDAVAPRTVASSATFKPDFKEAFVLKSEWMNQLRYKIQPGDTLTKIARKFGTEVSSLHGLNHAVVPNKHTIRAGDQLILPQTFYVVKAGDNYTKIGREFGIDAQKLMALNGARSSLIHPGQELRVPAVLAPEHQKVRREIKELVASLAKAEAALFFGAGSFTSSAEGTSFWTSGPVESGKHFEFSNDMSRVKVWDAAAEDAPAIPVKGAEGFRQLLVGDVMTAVLNARAYKDQPNLDWEKLPLRVLAGPTAKGGTISFTVKEPGRHKAEVVYETRTGKLSYTPTSTKKTTSLNAGKNPEDVARAMARLFKLQIPLYPFED